MFGKAWSKANARASAVLAATAKFVAGPATGAGGPEAGPSGWIGGRARRYRPETGTLARRRGRSLAAGAFAATVLFALAAALAAPAQAQTPTEQTLVSNLGETRSTSVSQTRQAQPFTTGTNIHGYVLTKVTLHFRSVLNGDASNIRVRIFTVDSDGEPDSALYTLVNPSNIGVNANSTFTAPANATLAPNTTYALEVGGSGGGSAGLGLARTASHAENSGAAPGWSIGNTRYYRSGSSWDTSTSPVFFGMQGTITPLPAVTIERVGDGARVYGEESIGFVVSRGEATAGDLDVDVVLSDYLRGHLPDSALSRTITIGDGGTGAAFYIQPDEFKDLNNGVWTVRPGTIKAKIVKGDGYRLGSPASASVTMNYATTVGFGPNTSSYRVDEGTRDLDVTFYATTGEGMGAPTQRVEVQYSTAAGSATSPGDFTARSGSFFFEPSDSECIQGGYDGCKLARDGHRAKKTVTLNNIIKEDTIEEGDETFRLVL